MKRSIEVVLGLLAENSTKLHLEALKKACSNNPTKKLANLLKFISNYLELVFFSQESVKRYLSSGSESLRRVNGMSLFPWQKTFRMLPFYCCCCCL